MYLLSKLPRSLKIKLRAAHSDVRQLLVRAFLSYDAEQLAACLRSLGIERGDSLMLHSAFAAHHGFRGTITELTDVFLDSIGPEGNLLMVSLPYRSSSLEYLTSLKSFDVRKTPSMMGLVSEYFRRRPNVVRSLHPTHPVLASGPGADWIIAEHPKCLYPCGPSTPFERMHALDGKAVFFNVPLDTLTFFHYLEHLVSPDLPFALYTEKPFEVPVINRAGERTVVTTYAFTFEAIRRRRFQVLEKELRSRGLIRERRLGNSRIIMVHLRDVVDCVQDMRRGGRYFYDLADLSRPSRISSTLTGEA